MRKELNYILLWRVFFIIPIFVGYFYVSYRNGYAFSNVFNTSYLNLNQIVYSLANFDGVRYLQIAQRGYVTEGAFFPLFPYLIRNISLGTFDLSVLFWVGLTVANICTFIGLIFLSKLLRLDYPKEVASKTILYLLVFPSAFFLGMVYSESLFLMCLVLSFYLMRKGKWGWAIFSSTLLCATRLVGVFIIPALLFEYWKKHGFRKKILLLVFPLTSDIVYAFYCYFKWNDYLYFLHAHSQLANGRSTDSLVFIPQTLYRYLRILITLPYSQYEWGIAFFELIVFIFTGVLLLKAYRDKIRLSYLIYAVPAFLLPSFSGTFSGLPRYILILFPVFLSLALFKSKAISIIYILLGITIQFLLVALFSRGFFVA